MAGYHRLQKLPPLVVQFSLLKYTLHREYLLIEDGLLLLYRQPCRKPSARTRCQFLTWLLVLLTRLLCSKSVLKQSNCGKETTWFKMRDILSSNATNLGSTPRKRARSAFAMLSTMHLETWKPLA